MISVEEAKSLLADNSQLLPSTEIRIQDCFKHFLSKDVLAAIDLPPFRQSAMDGYAVNFTGNSSMNCIGELPAGSSTKFKLEPNQAVRIFTGAAVPEGANLIIMQEWIVEQAKNYPDTIELLDGKHPREGDHIRPQGEQIKIGAVAMHQGEQLNSAAISYLQSFGYQTLDVIQKPTVSIVITGDELIAGGQELKHGQIYESNSIAIQKTIEEAGFEIRFTAKCDDNLEQSIETIKSAMEASDLCIISGGISVGEYDYVYKALEQNQLSDIFYKVRQKPGKPLYFGIKESKSVFALPGNPAAALSCIYEYVIPHLRMRAGSSKPWSLSIKLPIADNYTKKGDRAQFLKAYASGNEVRISSHQASSMLSSFTQANCLVYIPADQEMIAKGNLVEVHLI